MFIREKRNKSGTVSVQLVSKASGSYRVVKTVGCGRSQAEIAGLLRKAKDLLPLLSGRPEMDFVLGDDAHFAKAVSEGIEGVQLLGPELVLGKLFDEIGFGAVTMDPLLRLVVLSRLVFPLSKLKTTEYVARHSGLDIDVARIYRFMDKLDARLLKRIRLISYEHSMKVLGGTPSVVFYDVTTLYFEAEQEDDLRKAGFSKDGKHQSPQILLGLLVGPGGYPLAYDIFEGNKFEGHTMLPVIEAFRKDYQLDKLVVVADAGLLSKENIDRLRAGGQEFILGARIKNEGKAVKELVLALDLEDGQSAVVNKPDGTRLVVSYSEKRSRKDAHNRERGLGKLREMVGKGRLTKDHVSNRGYKKFLSIQGSATVNVDEGKVAEDAKWDGLKGYITNSKLEKQEVIDNYRQLWAIEKAFRISKTDLRIRPIYHRLRRRIEAHIGIAFAAHKIYKELERQLKERKVPMSPEKAIEVLRSIYGIRLRLPQTQQSRLILIDKAEEQQIILKAFGI
jgi:transposase